MPREIPEKFLVAFSFAGEQRDLVRAVVEEVERELGPPNVFFDEWFEYYIAGDDADLKLQKIYGERCALAVVCISERYGNKPWTRAEHAAIRSRNMKSQASLDERERLSVLPVRVGDGEVEGILFSTIAPDIRTRTPHDAATLILDRLRLIVPGAGRGAGAVPDWPQQPPAVHWPMADHSEARAAFEQLLTRQAAFRFLPISGPSEAGKTQITNQMLGNALRVPDLACGRFDFKGTTDMDAEVRAFVQQLEVPVPTSGQRLNERLGHVLDALRKRARPALLVFDTYEAAGEAGDWLEKQLLPNLIRSTWLRVVVVGQRVPEPSGAIWESISSKRIELKAPQPEEWFEFGRQFKPDLTLEFVRTAHQMCGGKASVLAALLGPEEIDVDANVQLRLLQEAQGDPAKLALAMVDLAYPALNDSGRAAVKEALKAAAIPHWCDEAILARMLHVSARESGELLANLRGLSMVEPFPARGNHALNVHEAARWALRKRMSQDEPARFLALSSRAAALFESETSRAGKIEWVYHALTGDPERGVSELQKMNREWPATARQEDVYALAAALEELEKTHLVQGRARVWALIVQGWTRVLRGEAAQLTDEANEILALSRPEADARAEGEAQAMLGDAFQAQGRLKEALRAYEEYLSISRRLAEQDPANTGWQQDLAVAHRRVGAVFEAQGKRTETQQQFEAALRINQRLAAQDPENPDWQRGLGVAHNRMGIMYHAQGRLTEALAAFEADLSISRRLAERDPDNDGWQRDLAVAHQWAGSMFERQGKWPEAEASFEAALAIHQRLVQLDPANANWLADLASTHDRVSGTLVARGRLAEAQAGFEAALKIDKRLAQRDPENAEWQRALALAFSRLGGLFEQQGKLADAQAAFEAALPIHQRLAQQDAGNRDWQAELADAHKRLGGLLQAQGLEAEASDAFQTARAIFQRLAERNEAQAGDGAVQ